MTTRLISSSPIEQENHDMNILPVNASKATVVWIAAGLRWSHSSGRLT
jgi:hypothetical protein